MGHQERSTDFAVAPRRRAPGVRSMVGYRTSGPSPVPHRGLPSSAITFIVALDDGVRAAATAEELVRVQPAPVILGGLQRAASYVHQCPGQSGIQLSVHPLASRILFGVPAREISVTDFDATEGLGAWARDLPERTAHADAWSRRFDVIAGSLMRQYDRHVHGVPAIRPDLLHAWRLLESSGGRMPIHDLASAVGLGTRRLGMIFQQEFGRSPKQIASLMRFEGAVGEIATRVRRSGGADLAEVATGGGFSDQAHLTREFTRFSGRGPREWITEEFRNIQDGGHGTA